MPDNLETRVAVIEREIENLDHRLFGNGQPGAIDRIGEQITVLETKISDRLKSIEERTGKMQVAIAAICAAGGGGLSWIVQNLF